MASETNTPTKSSKGGVWDNNALLVDLSLALYQALEHSNGLGPAVKDAIPEYLASQGHNVTWNAIR